MSSPLFSISSLVAILVGSRDHRTQFSKDHSTKVWLQLTQWFLKRRLKVRQTPSDGKKGCTRLAVASDKVYQLLAHGRWFSPGTPASSTTKTGRHDIAEILLKVALKHQKSKYFFFFF